MIQPSIRYANLPPDKRLPSLFLINSLNNKKIQCTLKEVINALLLMNKNMNTGLNYLLESRKILEALKVKLKDPQLISPKGNGAKTDQKEEKVLDNAVDRVEMAIDFLNQKISKRKDFEYKKSFIHFPETVLHNLFSFFRFPVGQCAQEFDVLKTICRIYSAKLYPMILGIEPPNSLIVDLFLKQVKSVREPYHFVEKNLKVPDNIIVRSVIQFFTPCDIELIRSQHCLTSQIVGTNVQQMNPLKSDGNPVPTFEEIRENANGFIGRNEYLKAERYIVDIIKNQQAALIGIVAEEEGLGHQHPDYVDSLSTYVKTLNCLANVYFLMGSFKEAEVLFNRCHTLGEKVFANDSFLVELLNNLGSINSSLGKTLEVLSYHERAKDVQEGLNPNHSDYFKCLGRIAECHLSQNKYKEAIDLYEIVLNKLEETNPAYISALSGLASAYSGKGDYNKSEEYCDKYYKLASEQSADKVDLGVVLNNVGIRKAQISKPKEAMKFSKRALKIQTVWLGIDHPNTLHTIQCIANYYEKLNKYSRAVTFYKMSSALQMQVIGEKHPNYIKSLSYLAQAYRWMDKLNESEELFLKCLNIGKVILREDKNPYLKTIYNNYGSLKKAKGNYKEALLWYQFSKQYHAQLGLDPCDPENLIAQNNIASIYSSLGQFNQALKIHTKVLKLKKKAYKDNPAISIATTISNMGVIHQNLGNFDEALKCFEERINIIKQVFDKDNDDAGMINNSEMMYALQNLATAKKSKGDYEGALSDYQQALDISIKISNNADSTITASCMCKISDIYFEMKNHLKAFEFAEKSLQIRKNILGDSHPDTATSLHTLGYYHQRNENNDRAASYYEQALEIRMASFPANSPEISLTRNNLSVVYQALKQYDKALALLETSLQPTIEIFGADHLNVAITHCNLANLFNIAKSYQRSLECYEKAYQIQKMKQPNHPFTLSTLGMMAKLNVLLEQYNKAIGIYEEIKELIAQKKKKLIESPSTEETRKNILQCDEELKQITDNISYCYSQLNKTQSRLIDSCSKEF